tara:strand:- start:479 stop:946 length:468 start_codon:yes stop_codon:yes gene_type:complete
VSRLIVSNIETQNIKFDSDTTAFSINSSGALNTSSIIVKGEGTNTTNLQQGLAKAWSNNNMSGTPAFNDSFNFSTITDTATGRQSLNYTNSMSNANYASGSVNPIASSGTAYASVLMREQQTTALFAVMSVYVGGSVQTIYDFTSNGLVVHGDLA